MKIIIHKLGKKNIDGKTIDVKRISLVYPDAIDWLAVANGHFTKAQKKKAKRDYLKYSSRHVFAYRNGRNEIIKALASVKTNPRMNLKVTLLKSA